MRSSAGRPFLKPWPHLVQPVVIGADLIQEAREIERQATLLAVRRAIESVSTKEPNRAYSYSAPDRPLGEYRREVLGALDRLAV